MRWDIRFLLFTPSRPSTTYLYPDFYLWNSLWPLSVRPDWTLSSVLGSCWPAWSWPAFLFWSPALQDVLDLDCLSELRPGWLLSLQSPWLSLNLVKYRKGESAKTSRNLTHSESEMGRKTNEWDTIFEKKYIFFGTFKIYSESHWAIREFICSLWSLALMNGKQCFVIEQSFPRKQFILPTFCVFAIAITQLTLLENPLNSCALWDSFM